MLRPRKNVSLHRPHKRKKRGLSPPLSPTLLPFDKCSVWVFWQIVSLEVIYLHFYLKFAILQFFVETLKVLYLLGYFVLRLANFSQGSFCVIHSVHFVSPIFCAQFSDYLTYTPTPRGVGLGGLRPPNLYRLAKTTVSAHSGSVALTLAP